MRIKNIHLKDYKRFTELAINEIPETAKLVVLVGPNGSGKSSVFDSFLLKARADVTNYKLSGGTEQYYEKKELVQNQSIREVANRVIIEFHNANNIDLKAAFQVRSAYRNEADFRIEQLQSSKQAGKGPRLTRIIDVDAAVSANYARIAWKGLQDVFHYASTAQTIGEYRKDSLGDLQEAMRSLFSDPELLLQDFGAIEAESFRFMKGSVNDFHYKNLSGGEKAAFDILLDVFVKRHEAEEAVYCIDEPELHVATGLQGRLIAAVLKLLPEAAQLWIATHSIGIVREAYRMQQEKPAEVAFLDFSGHDFDAPVTIKPSVPNRTFWANIYKIALDDLASLVAPQRIIICEGSADKHIRGFDADCYNRIFENEFPETLFVSRGGAGEVIQSKHLVGILKAIAEGTEVYRLIDRDDMTEDARKRKLEKGILILRRREIEEYLYDREVLRTFMKLHNCQESAISEVLKECNKLIDSQEGPRNVKDVSGYIFNVIKRVTKLPNLGNTHKEFALHFLVKALRETSMVFDELREDVFGSP